LSSRRFKACVVQYRLLHYRSELFDRLRASTDAAGIDLVLVHGQPTAAERARQDTATLPWAVEVHNRVLRIGGRDILWQPMPAEAQGSDLVVLMQENRLLSNYPWLFNWHAAGTRVAYWGHGRNLQSTAPSGLRERWKQLMLKRVDWWFAYTELTRDMLREAQYPDERITVLNNAIDNTRFERDLASVEDAAVADLRRQVGAVEGSTLGLYCGSLYPDKRLDLLRDACERVVAQRPDFRLVVIGDGPSRDVLERASARPWLRWVGARRGVEKAAWFRAAQLVLSPGAVGLHVLDSFVAGTPMVTTADALHGPEIAYLEHDVNGLVCAGHAPDFARAVLDLMADAPRAARLRAAAQASAARYSLDEMVHRFTAGMQACLVRPRLQR
jgi:glycosyltransferase involved in cell wall biosynthesis